MKSGGPRLTEELLRHSYSEEGLSVQQIARRFGLTLQYVEYKLRILGLVSIEPSSKGRKLSQDGATSTSVLLGDLPPFAKPHHDSLRNLPSASGAASLDGPDCVVASPPERLSGAVVRKLYLEDHLSMPEIAAQYGVTRQFVYKLMKQSGIHARDMSEARGLALLKERVTRKRVGSSGEMEEYTLQGGRIDEQFFASPSREMAWVLGLLFSDGCIHEKPPAVSLSQADPEVLQKSLHLMKSNSRISFSERRGAAGPLFHWRIGNKRLLAQLARWGLGPRKSLTMRFPEIPVALLPDFIRGLWDGDGTIYESKSQGKISYRASYVSGSKDFLDAMVLHLVSAGLPNRTIYKDRRSNGWSCPGFVDT